MTDLLIFRLFGPFASWGEHAVGEVRPTATRPTRSALLGLLGAALGLERGAGDEPHLELAAALRFAVRIDSPGLPAVDYQTINYRKPERKELMPTRADELRVRRDLLSTTQSWRHYRADSVFTVAVAAVGPGRSLAELREALERPFFPLSLGRKSCVLALPLGPELIATESLASAFAAYDQQRSGGLPAWYPSNLPFLRSQSCYELAVDLDFPQPLLSALEESAEKHVVVRRDEILSRRRWRFANRRERVFTIPRSLPADEEVGHVSKPSHPG
jgi:CRISPR system Cascade subunit CasD